MNASLKNSILRLLKREIVPATGCTEPVAVALAAARARELAAIEASQIEAIECSLSANIIKNAMGVGIPGTGMIGLPIAVALGVIMGKSERGLELLCRVTDAQVAAGRALVAKDIIKVSLAEDASPAVYRHHCAWQRTHRPCGDSDFAREFRARGSRWHCIGADEESC